METILTAATVIAALVLATTALVKKVIPDNKWLPVINVLVGLLIGLAYALTMAPAELTVYGWAGFISGLAAGGFYDLGANAKGLVNQSKANKLVNSDEGGQDNNSGGEV